MPNRKLSRTRKGSRKGTKKCGGFFGLSMGSGSLKKQGKRVTFAAKLAAFVLENHKGDKVEFAIKGGFADDQKYIFGILPFLHLNITKDQFRQMLKKEGIDAKQLANKEDMKATISSIAQDAGAM